jgi:hypothetical protein
MSTRPLLILALACGLAGAAAAAELTGVVVSADPTSITLRQDDGTETTHSVAPGVSIRGSDGTTLDPGALANQRVQVEVDEASRVTAIELADSADVGRMGGDVSAAPPADPAEAPDDAAAADDPTGGAEDRAAQAGDPAAPDPAGGEMARAELPDTAGPVALVALIGGGILAAAYATRAYRRR